MTGSDTHADTIREAFGARLFHLYPEQNWIARSPAADDPHAADCPGCVALEMLDALVAERDRERARADRAEAALEPLAAALSWALDAQEICLSRLDEIDGPFDETHLSIRAAGFAKARDALSAGSGGRETT